jgi:hypothetical protein
VGLSEVLAAVSHEAAATLSGRGTLTGSGTVTVELATAEVAVAAHAGEVIISYPADTGSAADSLSVVRQADVEKLSSEAARGKLPAVLQNANHRILVAVILLAAIYPVLPPEVQAALNHEGALLSAIAAILALLKS